MASNEIFNPVPVIPAWLLTAGETRVTDLGRAYPLRQLRAGDIVTLQIEQDSRAKPHMQLIQLQRALEIGLSEIISWKRVP